MSGFQPVTMSVIGCGYLGAVHAAAMAQLGHPLRPDRIVFGLGSEDTAVDDGDVLRRSYESILGTIPLVITCAKLTASTSGVGSWVPM